MIWLPLYLSLFSGPAVDPELEKAVQTYWDLLQKGDKAGALRYVVPEGQNLFLNRRTNPFRSWELDQDRAPIPGRSAGDGEGAADAVAGGGLLSRALTRGLGPPTGRVADSNSPPESGADQKGPCRRRPAKTARAKTRHPEGASQASQDPLPGPDPTRCTVRIRNGLSETVHVSRFDYDKTRFELLESGDSVAAGQELRLVFPLHRERIRETPEERVPPHPETERRR